MTYLKMSGVFKSPTFYACFLKLEATILDICLSHYFIAMKRDHYILRVVKMLISQREMESILKM